ncbi:hypothetical protein [Moorena sp. SIO4G3]|uniref:hypothetical protein n=1 Tax=Moorena sp. SIO4G3 TaxID=2607821 RepID=UPI00142A4E0D|nr:hypothetical protein [Moorena sp. SIO4G3]NEO74781.1 hypothetical protein [Moorena sp. SIO4G3]
MQSAKGGFHNCCYRHFSPSPHSLLPTPYSLLPTPYSLLPTPYSLLPKTQELIPHPNNNCYKP